MSEEDPRIGAEKYFNNWHQPSVSHFSPREMKFLEIRNKLRDYVYAGSYKAFEAMLLGVLYSDKEFCRDMVCWRNSWHQDRPTLMHEIIDSCKSDPPLELLQMVLDIALPKKLLLIPNISNSRPIDRAIWTPALDGHKCCSLQIVKFLAEADESRRTLTEKCGTFGVLERSLFRGDENVARYLLSLPECKEGFLDREKPLFYASRDMTKDDIPIRFIQLWIDAAVDELLRSGSLKRRPCCLYTSVVACRGHIYNSSSEDAIMRIVARDQLFCTRHTREEVLGEELNGPKKKRQRP